jgi:voltage-gated potassium channel
MLFKNSDMKNIKTKIAFYLNDSQTSAGKVVDLILLAVNIVACGVYVGETYWKTKNGAIETAFFSLEIIIATFFSIEYLLRIFIADKKMHYIFSFYGMIDLISIIPSFIPGDELKFLRVLKVLRILRFLRFLETDTFFFGRISKFQLQVLRTIFTVFTILFVSAGLIYSAETISKIPNHTIHTFGEAFYFTVTTLSTVGFGDFVPISRLGMAFTAIMIMGGAILIPWQVGKLIRMLVAGEGGKKSVTCPQCGLVGHDPDASHCKACGHVIYQEYQGE